MGQFCAVTVQQDDCTAYNLSCEMYHDRPVWKLFFSENKPFPRDEWDLPQRSACKKPEPHAETLSKGLQHLPKDVVPSSRVSFNLIWLFTSCCCFFPVCLSTPILHLILFFSYGDFQAYTRCKKNKTYICKPDMGCQGKGIIITKDIQAGEHLICQVYISRVRLC